MSRELIEVPLNKLVVSDGNVRRTGAADGVEELAASILTHGLLQPLLVSSREDGRYSVIAGSRRLMALKLLAKRKALPRGFTVPVMVKEAGEEESLAENVVRIPLHPADQFEAFRRLELSGLGAAEIAARFGVSLRIVRQRLALGAASPHLMKAYRESELTLAQLEAFTVTDDSVRQDEVYQALGAFREPWRIKAALTQADVSGRDRRVQFLGLDAYELAGGGVLRDLFSTTDEVWLTDVALLDRLCLGKLGEIADQVNAEGWLWTDVALEFPHGHGCRRVYPHAVDQDDEAVEQRLAASMALEALYQQHPHDEVGDEVAAEMARLEEEIAKLSEQAYAYDPDVIARAGAFVVLGHDGQARIERGFIRPHDEVAEPQEETGEKAAHSATSDSVRAELPAVEPEIGGVALSDRLIADLSAQRTIALRDALDRQPEIALLALAHSLILQGFYGVRHNAPSCLSIRIDSPALAHHAEGIDDGPAARAIAERHEEWARLMPQEAEALWDWLAALDRDSRDALLAHVVGQSVNALILPHERRTNAIHDADRLAQATGLAMRDYWSPTVPAYLGRVTKTAIMQAVSEGVSDEAAQRLGSLTRVEMAREAERLLVETAWLPVALRTSASKVESERDPVAFANAAEYILRRENIIALGNSGTGKTHVALALGLAACQKGFSVAFATAASLVNQLLEARDEKRLLRLQRELQAVKLLIVDELGYVPLSPTGAELLFEVFSQRYERGSTIVTSNLPFEDWTSVLGSERLTGALLDRLTHHVSILAMNGDSYRLRQSAGRRRATAAAEQNQATPDNADPETGEIIR